MGAGSSAEANGRMSNSSKCSSTLELFDMCSISLSEQGGMVPSQPSKGTGPHEMSTVAEKASPKLKSTSLPTSLTAKRGVPAIEAAVPSRNDREVPVLHALEERKGLPAKTQRPKTEHSCRLPQLPMRTPLPECLSRADRQRTATHAESSRKDQDCSLSSYSVSMTDALAAMVEKQKKTSQLQRQRSSRKETEGLLPPLPGRRADRKSAAGASDEAQRNTGQTSPHPTLEPQSGWTGHSTALPVLAPTVTPTLQPLASTATLSSGDSHNFYLFAGNDQNASRVPLGKGLQSFIDDGGYGMYLTDMKLEGPTGGVAEATPEPEPAFTPQLSPAQGEALSSEPDSDTSSVRLLRAKRRPSLLSKRSRRGSFVSFGGEVRLA
ncbi:hypothetical protein GH5_01660 [Leishmania sp. Ghana 2012 LV757]|uniref:hypothetical protein n=1 Tax=Leishmania sp. Ghana 2012 LV757 TaxID=2803181 RepID=UPI001B593EA6|nr:hypothetical protein GH5_01660 [Leishmania sp. Ghana 2012 LV757]